MTIEKAVQGLGDKHLERYAKAWEKGKVGPWTQANCPGNVMARKHAGSLYDLPVCVQPIWSMAYQSMREWSVFNLALYQLVKKEQEDRRTIRREEWKRNTLLMVKRAKTLVVVLLLTLVVGACTDPTAPPVAAVTPQYTQEGKLCPVWSVDKTYIWYMWVPSGPCPPFQMPDPKQAPPVRVWSLGVLTTQTEPCFFTNGRLWCPIFTRQGFKRPSL